MNKKQKTALIAVAALVLGMLLHPPYHRQLPGGGVIGLGYGWIFEPPFVRATVDIGLLIAQWIAVLIVGGIAYLMLKESTHNDSGESKYSAPEAAPKRESNP